MKIEKKDGIIIKTMSFCEAFIDPEIVENMTKEQQDYVSREIIEGFNQILLIQPERLSEKTLYNNEEEMRLEKIHFLDE